MNIVMLGPPGSGKGTQGAYISSKYGLQALSAGDILRREIENKTQTGLKIQNSLNNGKLVEDSLVISILRKSIVTANGTIFDGFPRTVPQAKALQEMLSEFNSNVSAVLYFDILEQTLVERIANRYICAVCGATYNKLFNFSKVDGVCDKCGSKNFKTRADDNIDTIKVRFAEYKNLTLPLSSYYREKGVLHSIDASMSVDEVHRKVDLILKNLLT